MTGLMIMAIALLGFAALAASMDKHRGAFAGIVSSRRHQVPLRVAGWAMLIASLAYAIGREGSAIGIVYWLGTATIAALCVALFLTCRKLWLGK